MFLAPGLRSTFDKPKCFLVEIWANHCCFHIPFHQLIVRLPVEYGLARQVSVQLVEASGNIMGSFDEKLIDYTIGLLRNRKVSCEPPVRPLARLMSYPLSARTPAVQRLFAKRIYSTDGSSMYVRTITQSALSCLVDG